MAKPRKKSRKERLNNLDRSEEAFCTLFQEVGDNVPPDIQTQFEVYVSALADAHRDFGTDYADDSLIIATSAQQQLTHLTARTGFRVRSGIVKAGKSPRAIDDEIDAVLKLGRSQLPAGGPPYDQGVQAKIIRSVAYKLKRSRSATKKLFERHKIFE